MTQTEQPRTPDGYTLVYTIAGQPGALPVMMVHGWLSHRGVWRQTIDALQDSHCCVAIDLLGFGDSDKPARADYSIPAQGRRVLQLADALGWERFALMGHSMGGQIALCIASMLAPHRITQLVSVAGGVSARLNPYLDKVVYKFIALGKAFPPAFALFRRVSRYR
jgi:pimeloyl-ACP methyl ester carboxylesterase